MKKLDFEQKLAALSAGKHSASIKGIMRGIEREALRIKQSGGIAKTAHPKQAGHALTHGHITTDFSESLLEFITPVSENIDETLQQLSDLQKYTLSKMQSDEMLWPMSMPCFIDNEEDIVLAQYGDSNIAKMKTLYREGLKNRYGSMMQAISGVHFNISFPNTLWQSLKELENNEQSQSDFISSQYLALIRNFKRELWLISFLFGASPSLCQSFLQGRDSPLNFKKSGKGTLYLEHGTALRLGDLGYTNSAQSSLRVMYNSLPEYVAGLQQAIRTPSALYDAIPDYKASVAKQLNKNILQIENEFYSPIRPKRNAESGETPTQALARGGIEYIEIRALDVNPFCETGISKEQVHFLDVFLTYCLLKESPDLSWEEQQTTEANLQRVVNAGRDPALMLSCSGEEIKLTDWATDIFADLASVAKWVDTANGVDDYSKSISKLSTWISKPEQTFSGRLIAQLETFEDSGKFALHLAQQYKQSHTDSEYHIYNESMLDGWVKASFEKEIEIKQADTLDFGEFLTDYFNQA